MRSIADRDAVITGLGLFTALGQGVPAHDECLGLGASAASGPRPVEEPLLRVTIPEDLEAQAKFLNGSGKLAVTAVAEAVVAARLEEAGLPDHAKGLYLAQSDFTLAEYAGYRPAFVDATEGFTIPVAMPALNASSVRKMNPFHLLETINNNAFSFLSAWHGLRGANTSVSGWSGPGLEAVSLAARTIVRGDAKAAVVCGTGRSAGVTSVMELRADRGPCRRARPRATAPRRWSSRRSRRRGRAGVTPLAAIVGSGAACGPAAEGEPVYGDAVRTAAEQALAEAGAGAGDVDLVVAPSVTIGQALVEALPILGKADVRSFRAGVGHIATASDVVDVALVARWMSVPERNDDPRGALVIAAGLDGQASAVVLARMK